MRVAALSIWVAMAACLAHSVEADFGGHDLFTSLGQLHELWKNERTVVNQMEKAIESLELITGSLKKYVKSHSSHHLDQEPSLDFLGQPLNGYFLIRHVALGWEEIRTLAFDAENATRAIFGAACLLLDNLRAREQQKLPAFQDITGAAFGLARLHSLYDLNDTAMVKEGVIIGNKAMFEASQPSVLKLTGWDMELIATESSNNGLYNTMVNFFQHAFDYYRKEQDLPAPFEMFLRTKTNIELLEKHLNTSLRLHDEILLKRGSRSGSHRTHDKPLDPKLRKKKKFQPVALTAPFRDEHKVRLIREREMPEENSKSELQKEMLCIGEKFRLPSEDSGLYCTLAHNDSPWLRLAPIKIELRSKVPYLVVIHELMLDHECNNITAFLGPRLDFPPGRMNPRKRTNDWTMKNAWPYEHENLSLERMTRRLEHLLGLLAASNLGQADAFMCGNYGIGGHYGIHPDYYSLQDMDFSIGSNINRVATVMTILESPSAGGATVFPYLGVASFPAKGTAVMWFNTKSDATPDPMLLHAACPVLLGQKWIGNKWISYAAQWQKRPCGLKPETRYMGPLH